MTGVGAIDDEPDDAAGEPSTPAPAAYRAGTVLELLARRSSPVTVTEAARSLGLAKSSLLNVMVSLEATGLVRRSAQGWLLGYKTLELSRSAMASTDLVLQFHQGIAATVGLARETVVLAVLDGLDVIYVARHDGQQPVRFINEIGTRKPAAVTALGRAMLAALDPEDLEARLADTTRLPVLTHRSLRTVEELRRDLVDVRERGYAVDSEQGMSGICCYAVAVNLPQVSMAVSVSFLAERAAAPFQVRTVADLERLASRLRRTEPQ